MQIDALAQESLETIPPLSDREISLSDNALTVLRKRYLLRGPDGEPIETPSEMFWRLARVVAAPDAAYGADAHASARAFYDLLTSFRFMPNSPTFTGAGTPLGQLAACFVLPIEDDMGRDPAGIFSTLRVAALIQQTGGGNGFSFSRLRPKGARVSTSKGVATGPVGFLRVYDKAFGEIAQGGTRRGANMAVLRVDHPDILEFIRCKSQEGDITNFNISVGVTDAF
ncbi:MAG TPA: ribonucleotide reductase N-terminal alpha domain-containing protein, partial [Anaerolineae bacterium]|nr:ribonucleotide reductase N-terminal alpha domain-containing protein [Anaerolineae bacterium]